MAAAATRQIGAKASYFDAHRQSLPACPLANDYLAFKSVIQYKPGNVAFYGVPGSIVDYNELAWYEPVFTPADFLDETFHQAAIACYEEFRIRAVKIVMHAPYNEKVGFPATLPGVGVQNAASLPVPVLHSWIWYPETHVNLNPADELGSYTDMLESGEKIVPCGYRTSDTLTMRAVPQILWASGTNANGVAVFRDVPAPWLVTSAANLTIQYHMPFFVWRKPFSASQDAVANYQITMSAVIEFRNPRDSQL